MNKALLSSKSMCWCTPQDFFDKLNAEFDFVLDPAATDKTAKCGLYYTPETDGLSQSWDRGGAVFCNPRMAGKLANGCGRRLKNHSAGTPSSCLSQHERIHLIFTITSMGRRKSDLCVGVCGSRMKTEMSLLLRRFRLW